MLSGDMVCLWGCLCVCALLLNVCFKKKKKKNVRYEILNVIVRHPDYSADGWTLMTACVGVRGQSRDTQ